jgi:hypothetical protein
MFFDDFKPAAEKNPAAVADLNFAELKLRDYVCYVLLDFVTADPELDEMPLAAALEFTRQLELDAVFEKIVSKELKLKARDLRKMKESAAEMLASVEAPGE